MDITEGIKKVVLAGIGAAALSYEKSSELVDTLVKKGEVTVEQGKAINQELKHKAEEVKADIKAEKPMEEIVNGLSEEDLAKLKDLLNAKETKE